MVIFAYFTLETYYKNTVNQINHASLKFTFSMMLTCAFLKHFVDLTIRALNFFKLHDIHGMF